MADLGAMGRSAAVGAAGMIALVSFRLAGWLVIALNVLIWPVRLGVWLESSLFRRFFDFDGGLVDY